MTVLVRIILPLSKAIIAVMVLFYGVGHWNSWFNAAIYLDSRSKYPLQLILREILISNDTSAMGNDLSAISPTIGDCTVLQGIANIFLLATFIISLFIVWSRLGERPVVWQKNGTTVMILTVAAIAMLPFTQLFPVDLKFFAVPFSFCLCHRLSLPRKHTTGRHKPWRNHLYDLLFILIIIAAILC